MSMFQRLLLIPCLAPLLALLVLSATNVGDKTRIRLLVWTTPPLPVGAWTALAGVGGAAGAAVAAVLVSPVERPLSRQRRSPVQPEFEERGYRLRTDTQIQHKPRPRKRCERTGSNGVCGLPRDSTPFVSPPAVRRFIRHFSRGLSFSGVQ